MTAFYHIPGWSIMADPPTPAILDRYAVLKEYLRNRMQTTSGPLSPSEMEDLRAKLLAVPLGPEDLL